MPAGALPTSLNAILLHGRVLAKDKSEMPAHTTKKLPQIFALLVFFFTLNYHALMSTGVENLYPFVYGALTVFLCFALFGGGKMLKQKALSTASGTLVFLLLWFVFALLLFVSELLSNELLEFPMFLFFIPLLAFFILPGSSLGLREIELAVILASAPFTLMGFVFSFMGHRFDSNSIALIVLSGAVALVAYGSAFLNKKSQWPYYWLAQIFLFVYAFTLLRIKSRTALLAFAGVYVFNIFLDVAWIRVLPKSRARWMVLYYALIGLLAPVFLLLKGLPSFAAAKWGSDISSHRFTIWQITLDNAKWLGQGYHFFPRHGLLGPHNFLFGVLAYAGILGLLAMLALLAKIAVDLLLAWTNNRPTLDKKVLRAHISPVLGDPDSTGVVLSPLRELILFSLLFLLSGLFEATLQYPAYRVINLMWFSALGYFYFAKAAVAPADPAPAAESKRQSIPRAQRLMYLLPLAISLLALLSVLFVEGDGNVLNLVKKLLGNGG